MKIQTKEFYIFKVLQELLNLPIKAHCEQLLMTDQCLLDGVLVSFQYLQKTTRGNVGGMT